MRRKRFLVALACVTAVVLACVYFSRTELKPRVSMGVLGYVAESDMYSPAAIVGLTNTGAITLRYDHVDPDEPGQLLMKTPTGWDSDPFHSLFRLTVSPMLLKPGSNIVFHIPLSSGTLSWQLKYTFRNASIQDRLGGRFEGEWSDRLYKWSGRLLLTNEGPPQVYRSEVFDVPLDTSTTPIRKR